MTHRSSRLLVVAVLATTVACGGDTGDDADTAAASTTEVPAATATAAPDATGSAAGDTTASSDSTTPTTAAPAQDTAADPSCPTPDGEATHPEILDVVLTPEDGGTYLVEVTVSSTYDTPDRYADGWRVLDPDGVVLAEHTLAHDHADEQPFTRSDPGVVIPDGVGRVTVEGRDLCNGYGGTSLDVDVPAPSA